MRRFIVLLLFGAIVKPMAAQVFTIPRGSLVISRTSARGNRAGPTKKKGAPAIAGAPFL
jgi:hypothetical protein